MKTLNVKLDDHTHRQLKALSALKGLAIAKLIKNFVDREIKENPEECELCRKYGHEPNAETAKVLRESRAGIGLSKPMSGEDYIKKLDRKGLKK